MKFHPGRVRISSLVSGLVSYPNPHRVSMYVGDSIEEIITQCGVAPSLPSKVPRVRYVSLVGTSPSK